MTMSRVDHWRRAQALIQGLGPQRVLDRDALMLAQVHATLATAPADVAGEYVELSLDLGSGPVLGGTREEPTVFGLSLDQVAELVDLRTKLAEVMKELDRRGGAPTTFRDVATSIRERVLGGSCTHGGDCPIHPHARGLHNYGPGEGR